MTYPRYYTQISLLFLLHIYVSLSMLYWVCFIGMSNNENIKKKECNDESYILLNVLKEGKIQNTYCIESNNE